MRPDPEEAQNLPPLPREAEQTVEPQDGATGPSTRARGQADAQASPDAQAPSFEEAFQRLEEIVRKLEGEELSLDESLRLFEEGIRLSRVCQARLEEAEGRIEILLAGKDGQLKRKEFELKGMSEA